MNPMSFVSASVAHRAKMGYNGGNGNVRIKAHLLGHRCTESPLILHLHLPSLCRQGVRVGELMKI